MRSFPVVRFGQFQRGVVLLAALAGCSEAGGTGPVPPPTLEPVAVVEITPSVVELEVGRTAQLFAEPLGVDGTPLDRPVGWASGDTVVALVSAQGLVTASMPGTTLVTASSAQASASARVTVVDGPDRQFDVVLHPAQDVQSIVGRQPPGTVFGFAPGTYERVEFVPKDSMVFIGGPGVVLHGLDQARFAFRGDAEGLHLKDLEITGYAGLNDDLAAIQGWDGRNWILENLYVHHNHTTGASVRHGALVIGGRYTHNGLLGIAVNHAVSVAIRGVEVAYNNADGRYEPLFSAGGVKVNASDDVTVEDSDVHDNNGPGIWYDSGCRNGRVLNNTVTANSRVGVFYEISYDGLVEGNRIEGNGKTYGSWHSAGVMVSSAPRVRVRGNIIRDNGHGVIGLQNDRGEGVDGRYDVRDLEVFDNEIEMSQGASGLVDNSGAGAPDMVTARGNVFDGNRYRIHETGPPFVAGREVADIDAWRALGQDLSSTFAVLSTSRPGNP